MESHNHISRFLHGKRPAFGLNRAINREWGDDSPSTAVCHPDIIDAGWAKLPVMEAAATPSIYEF